LDELPVRVGLISGVGRKTVLCPRIVHIFDIRMSRCADGKALPGQALP